MGISFVTIMQLKGLVSEYHLNGRALTLGRQKVWADHLEFTFLFGKPPIPDVPNRFGDNLVSDYQLFNALGFNSLASLDASDFEGADVVHDLNTPFDNSIQDRYDFIFDGGTLEHIFNTPMVLSNIFNILNPNGVIVHSLPANNFIDHGYYQFSPCLLYEYYIANRWDILQSFCTLREPAARNPHAKFDYTPGMLKEDVNTDFQANYLEYWITAKKNPYSTSGVIPQQGKYANLNSWKQGKT